MVGKMVELTMLDITAPQVAEVEISQNGRVLWVNIDGLCRLRVCRPKTGIKIKDHRLQRIRKELLREE